VKGTKTGDWRRLALEPNVLPLLQALHGEKKGEGVVIDLPSEQAMARKLRRWLLHLDLHVLDPADGFIELDDAPAKSAYECVPRVCMPPS
jgi:hypothetical protein